MIVACLVIIILLLLLMFRPMRILIGWSVVLIACFFAFVIIAGNMGVHP